MKYLIFLLLFGCISSGETGMHPAANGALWKAHDDENGVTCYKFDFGGGISCVVDRG